MQKSEHTGKEVTYRGKQTRRVRVKTTNIVQQNNWLAVKIIQL